MREIEIADAEKNFPALIAEIEHTGGDVLVTRDGKPAVRLIRASGHPSKADPVSVGRYLSERLDALARSHPPSAEPIAWPTLKGQMDEGRD